MLHQGIALASKVLQYWLADWNVLQYSISKCQMLKYIALQYQSIAIPWYCTSGRCRIKDAPRVSIASYRVSSHGHHPPGLRRHHHRHLCHRQNHYIHHHLQRQDQDKNFAKLLHSCKSESLNRLRARHPPLSCYFRHPPFFAIFCLFFVAPRRIVFLSWNYIVISKPL